MTRCVVLGHDHNAGARGADRLLRSVLQRRPVALSTERLRHQVEAGRTSGLSHAQTMRYIIVPQAFRRVIPPLTNEFVMLIKDTSLVSVIGLAELLRAARVLQSDTFNGTPLIAAALIYLAICLPLIYLANGLERRLNRRTA